LGFYGNRGVKRTNGFGKIGLQDQGDTFVVMENSFFWRKGDCSIEGMEGLRVLLLFEP